MCSHAKPRPYESLARLARWLGLDRNPLRRGTDRFEAALRLVMIIVVVAAVPAAAVAAGRGTDHWAPPPAPGQRAGGHPGAGGPPRQAPAAGIPDPDTPV